MQSETTRQYEERQKLLRRQQEKSALNWPTRLLEIPSLPGAAVQTALGIRSPEGVSPLAASLARLGGRDVPRPNVESFLQQQGVPELGGVETPLGRLTGRGLLGFAGEVATDPLTYLFPASQLRRGAQAAEKVGQAAGRAGGALPEIPSVAGQLTKATPTSAVERGAARLGQVQQPQTNRVLSSLNLISPRILGQSELAKPMTAYEGALAQWQDSYIPAVLARFETLLPENLTRRAGLNEPNLLLSTGKRVFFGDVAETAVPEHLGGTGIRASLDYIQGQVFPQMRNEYERLLNALPKKSQPQFALEGGFLERYFPRWAREIDTGDMIILTKFGKPVGTKRGFQKLRGFKSVEEGVASGRWEYVTDPVEVVKAHLSDMGEKMAQMQLLHELLPRARFYDKEALLALRGARTEVQAGRKQLQQSLADIRKGTATSETGQFLEQNYPEIFEELSKRGSVQSLPDGGYFFAPLTATGRKAIAKLHATERKAARTEIGQLTGELKAGTQRAIKAGRTTLAVQGRQGVSFLKDLWWKPDEAKEIADILTRAAPSALKAAQQPSTIVRATMANLDMSGFMIQGLTSLVREPRAFLISIKEGLPALWDASRGARYIARPENQYVYSKIAVTLTRGGGTEFGLTARTAFDQPGRAMGALEKVLAPSQRAFETIGDVIRTEWAKVLLPTVEKSGPRALTGAATFIDHATGIISSRAMGVGPTQRAWEGTVFFFAPRYLRASLAVIGDMLSSGVQRDEALKTLGSMMFVGIAWYTALSRAVGQEPVLDPSDTQFMTWQVGDQRIGIGSTWVSLARLAARLAIDPRTGQYDPTRIAQLDMDNPLLQFWRGRQAPATSTVWDLMRGESFSGYPTTDSLWDFTKYIGTKFLPFSIQGIAEMTGQGQFAPERVGTEIGAGVFGIRSFPQRYSERRDRLSNERYGQSFDQLDPAQQADVLKDVETPPPPGERGDRPRQLQEIYGTREEDIVRSAQQVVGGTVNKVDLRHRVGEVNARLGAQLDIVTPKPEGRLPEPLEQARQEYYDIIRAKDEFGRTDWDRADEFLADQPAEVRQYIENQQELAIRQLPEPASGLLLELRDTRKKLEPYWDIRDQVLERYGLKDKLDAMTPAERDQFKLSDRQYARAMTEVRRRKDQWRRRHLQEDKLGVEWGYWSKLIRDRR